MIQGLRSGQSLSRIAYQQLIEQIDSLRSDPIGLKVLVQDSRETC